MRQKRITLGKITESRFKFNTLNVNYTKIIVKNEH